MMQSVMGPFYNQYTAQQADAIIDWASQQPDAPVMGHNRMQ
jgi:hypothetical protein